MLIRAQFSVQTFADFLRFRSVSGWRPCSKQFFEAPVLGWATVTKSRFVGVTGVSLGDPAPAPYPNVLGPQLNVFQQRRIVLAIEYELGLTVGTPPTYAPSDVALTVSAQVAVDLRIELGKDVLAFSIVSANVTVLTPGATQPQQVDVTSVVSGALALGSIDLGIVKELAKLSGQHNDLIRVRHADLGFNPATQLLEIRIELQGPGGPSSDAFQGWSQFYADAFDTLSPGAPWAMFFDQRLGTTILQHTLTSAMDSTGRFNRDGALSVTWDPASSGFHLNVEGEVVDACYCLTENIDIDVRVWGDIGLTTVGNTLRVDVRFDWKLTNLLEAGCCVLTTIAFFPLVGLDMWISKKMLEWWEYLIGLVLYPNVVLLVIGALIKFAPAKDADLQPQGLVHQDPNDDKHFWVEFDLPAMKDTASCAGAEMNLGLAGVAARGDGFVLRGFFTMPPIVSPVIDVKVVKPLAYAKPYLGCNAAGDRPMGFEAVIELTRSAGNYDFRACDVTLGTLSQAIKQYTRVDITQAGCPNGAVVTIRIPYWAYDFQPVLVIIATSEGSRLVTLGPAAAVSQERRDEDGQVAALERVNRCYVRGHAFQDIGWLIDPPDLAVARMKHLWGLAGVVSAETERVTVSDGTRTLLTVDTSIEKAFRATLVNEARGLRVEQHLRGEWSEPNRDSGEIHVVQLLAAIIDEVVLGEPVLALDVFRAPDGRRLLVHGERGTALFSFGPAGHPIQHGRLDTANVSWVGRQGAALMAREADGRLLSLDLRSASRWQTGDRLGDAARERELTDLAPRFDHLLIRRPITESGGEATRVRGVDRVIRRSDALVSSRVDAALMRGRVTFHAEQGSTIVRITPSRFAVVREDGMAVEILTPLDSRA